MRERYAFPDADHTRVRNQQAFMRALLERVLSADTLTDPGAVQRFVSSTSAYLSVDPGLTFPTLVDLGWSLRRIRPHDLETFTLPTAGGGTSPDGQSYVEVDRAELTSLTIALRSDDVEGVARGARGRADRGHRLRRHGRPGTPGRGRRSAPRPRSWGASDRLRDAGRQAGSCRVCPA
ncbi:hypothetical protein [Curtobacterium sp. MCJR17_043]|uniref:LCP family protein n=1 Tax=Curtobacterium sp. MCJR17_043 TaxID=2175660 RepID=UPI0032E882F5